MHSEAFDYIMQKVDGLTFQYVVEFGSLNINGSIRNLFDCENYHGIDMQDGLGVDEIADASTWASPIPVDAIVCCEVLEHSPSAKAIVINAANNLVRNGWFFMTCAMDPRPPHSAIDGGKKRWHEHYRNIDPKQFRRWIKIAGFLMLNEEIHPERGDYYITARKVI